MSNIFIESIGISGGVQSKPALPQTSGASKLVAGSVVAEVPPEGEVLPESFSLALAELNIPTKAGPNDLAPDRPLLNGSSVDVLVAAGDEGLAVSSDIPTVEPHRLKASFESHALLPGGGTDVVTQAGGDMGDMQAAIIPEVAGNNTVTATVALGTPNIEASVPVTMEPTISLSWQSSALTGGKDEVVMPVEGQKLSLGESGGTPILFAPHQPIPSGAIPQVKITEVESAMRGAVTSVLAAAINSKSSTALDTSTAVQSDELASESNGSILAKMSGAKIPMPTSVKNMTQEIIGADLAFENGAEVADDAIDVKTAPTTTAAYEKPTPSTHNSEAKVVVQASVRVGMPGWADQIAERTANLVSQNIKQAEIQLNPQEMGSINVKISVTQEQAAVTFTVANGVVREALDQTLQRLRENFESEGMDLIQADVRDEQQARGEQGAESDSFSGDAETSEDTEGDEVVAVAIEPSGVDHFV